MGSVHRPRTPRIRSCSAPRLSVPLDYDSPTGDSIDLALVRVPATGDRKGAVLFNPGGPAARASIRSRSAGPTSPQGLASTTPSISSASTRGGVDRSAGIRCVSDQFEDQHLYVDDTPTPRRSNS